MVIVFSLNLMMMHDHIKTIKQQKKSSQYLSKNWIKMNQINNLKTLE